MSVEKSTVYEEIDSPVVENSGGELDESVISINRCAKVVKGGRNFSFGALVVVGNRRGNVGFGYGKANEVSDAIRKGSEIARKSLVSITTKGTTIPHSIVVKYRGAKIMMRPASPGTGLIAGGAMRSVLDLAGVRDILAKSQGSSNPMNVVKATLKAFGQLRTKKQILEKRGIETL
jgi:small subunit ribosomal protein S5